jgi:dTDP-glucose pyrophosphorylase
MSASIAAAFVDCSGVTGVILAAGRGHRMGRLGECFPKSCLPLCNKPLLATHFGLLSEMGIRDIVIVVGYKAETVERVARSLVPKNTRLRFVIQPEQKGIADALSCARHCIGEWMVLMLGDTHFVAGDLRAGVRMLRENPGAMDAVLSVRAVSDPDLIRNECTVRLDDRRRVLEIREKPATPWNNTKPCGVYFFSRRIFDAIAATPPSTLRNEIEITDAIQTLVRRGGVVECASTIEWDNNLTRPADLLRSNLYELRRRGLSVILGTDAEVHPGASLRDTVVGDGATIDAPITIERTLLLEKARVGGSDNIRDCIVGQDFVIPCGRRSGPAVLVRPATFAARCNPGCRASPRAASRTRP